MRPEVWAPPVKLTVKLPGAPSAKFSGAATDTITVSCGANVVVTALGVATVAVPFSVVALVSVTTIVSPAPSPSTALVGITMVPVVPGVSMVNDPPMSSV